MGSWDIWVGLGSLFLLMLLSALHQALRTASQTRWEEQFEKLGRKDAFNRFVATRPQYLLGTAIVRAALVLVLFVAVLYHLKVFPAGSSAFHTFATCVIVWLLVLVAGIAIPNAWAKYAGHPLIVHLLPLLRFFRILCYPLIVALQLFDPLVRRLAGVPVRDAESYAQELEQEILNVVSEGERHGAVDEEEKEMIESVIELTDTHVEEIMTPRTDMVALPRDADLPTVLETIRTKGHSRIPVYDGTIDTVLGILYAKDLLQQNDEASFSLTATMREAQFIPESKPVRDLLREFQTKRVHIAVVLDEYGGTAGLITIEDILEELVGEITDEYETNVAVELQRIDERTVEVDARMRIDDLNDELEIHLPDSQDYETIGGFLFSKLGRIPEVGETCRHEEVGLTVIAADPRRILRLRLEVTQAFENKEETA